MSHSLLESLLDSLLIEIAEASEGVPVEPETGDL